LIVKIDKDIKHGGMDEWRRRRIKERENKLRTAMSIGIPGFEQLWEKCLMYIENWFQSRAFSMID